MPLLGILGITENTLTLARYLLQTGEHEIIFWDRDESISLSLPVKRISNPFAVISQADSVMVTYKDEGSYGLIAECIFALKPVVLDNLQMFSIRELNNIIKLSHEAEIPVVPYIDHRLMAYACYIHQQFPDGICFVNGTIKGQPAVLHNNNPIFALMLLLTLMFKDNILHNHVETFRNHISNSPVYFHFAFSSGSAALFYQPYCENDILSFDVVGKNTCRYINLLDIIRLNEHKNFACHPCGENIISWLSIRTIDKPLLNLYDLKVLLQAYAQVVKVLEDSHVRMIR